MSEALRSRIAQVPPSSVVQIALQQSQLSPCQSQRGAVIFKVRDDAVHILGRGYNQKPRGFECDGSQGCKATCRAQAIHAEQMALLHGDKAGMASGFDLLHLKSVDGVLVPSGGPSCGECSKLILAAQYAEGVWLYHAEGWRRYSAHEFHALSLAALLAVPSPERQVLASWLSIETAPKDGTWIIGLTTDGDVRRVSWGNSRNYGEQWCSMWSWHRLTHWMPLPAAPRVRDEQESR